MNIILLSGGSGKRLWPLSNDIRSKQFIKIFKKEDAAGAGSSDTEAAGTAGGSGTADFEETHESMVQRVYRKIREIDPEATVTVATGKSQVSAIHNQLGDDVGISVEPCRRDTFPAIALATAYLHDVKGVGLDEPVVVCPVDPYVEDDYFRALQQLGKLAARGGSNLVLMGMEPTYPSEKYGYIIPENADPVAAVKTFKEKPDAETAVKYISEGALWNAGIFAYRLGYVLEKAHERLVFEDYYDLYQHYDAVEKISFDYAVVEQEPSISVMRFSGLWKDLGTWNTLTEAMEEETIGDVTLDSACTNVHVINQLDLPILGAGLHDLVVAASPDGILVSDLGQSSYIKPLVDQIEQPVRYAEKSWGSYQVIDIEDGSMTIKVTLQPGHAMNYHSHDRRDEVWTIVSGTGRTTVDGMEQEVGTGDVITMQAGCRHMIRNTGNTPLQVIEVQLGKNIDAADKHKYRAEGSHD